MAIELPRTSAASVSTARRPRRARLPDAGNVPRVGVASDPGLDVPDFSQVGRGLESLGQGVEDLGQGLKAREDRFAKAEERITKRRESVERMRAGRGFNDFANELFTEFSSTHDFSRKEDVEAFGEALNEKKKEILEAFDGSEEGRFRLEERLEPIVQAFSDRVGVASVKAQDALVADEFGKITNDLTARARMGEDPRVLIDEGRQFLEAEKDALRPGQEVTFIRNLNAQVWSAKIDSFLSRGDIDSAEEAVGMPEVRASIGEEGQRRIFNRIEAARREKTARILTPGELLSMGFPKDAVDSGLIVQRKSDGTTSVVFNPPRDRDEGVRQQKIDDVTDQLVRNGTDEQEARDRATNIVDGNIRIEIVPQTGEVREINDLTGEVRAVPLGGQQTAEANPPKRTLFELAASGAIAGVAPAIVDLSNRTLGQIPFVPVDEETTRARQEMTAAQNGLIRALALNPKFAQAEIRRIQSEIQIAPALFDSQRALIGRMKAIKDSLETRLANEQNAASDPNLPQDTRSNAAQAARDIKNFLDLLGEPPDEQNLPPEGVPDFSEIIKRNEDGSTVWQDPEGNQWIVE